MMGSDTSANEASDSILPWRVILTSYLQQVLARQIQLLALHAGQAWFAHGRMHDVTGGYRSIESLRRRIGSDLAGAGRGRGAG